MAPTSVGGCPGPRGSRPDHELRAGRAALGGRVGRGLAAREPRQALLRSGPRPAWAGLLGFRERPEGVPR
eukprot:7059132-Alexandrium_andersonii.AAC.1